MSYYKIFSNRLAMTPMIPERLIHGEIILFRIGLQQTIGAYQL